MKIQLLLALSCSLYHVTTIGTTEEIQRKIQKKGSILQWSLLNEAQQEKQLRTERYKRSALHKQKSRKKNIQKEQTTYPSLDISKLRSSSSSK